MLLFLYIQGMVLAGLLCAAMLKRKEKLTVDGIVGAVLATLLSWVGVLFIGLYCWLEYGSKVLWEKKKDDK